MRFMFKAEPPKTVADGKERVLAIGHSPAVYLKAHGFGSHASRVRLVTAGINRIFGLWIKSQFDSKKATTESAPASQSLRSSFSRTPDVSDHRRTEQ